MTGKLAAYKAPANVLEGEWFDTDKGVRVRCALPSRYNRKFQFETMKYRSSDDLQDAERFDGMMRAFNDTCILEIEDPDAPPLPLVIDEYFELISELFTRAMERSADVEQEQDKTVKKSKTS